MPRIGLENTDDLPLHELIRRGLIKMPNQLAMDRGAGKSMFMYNAIRHHLNRGGGIAYVSLEMDTADIVERIAAIQGGQDGTRRL